MRLQILLDRDNREEANDFAKSEPEQAAFIGNQAGGRAFLFLKTDDFHRDYEAFRARGVRFVRPPATHAYGKVAVFEDLYGNLWDLMQFADDR